MRVALAHPLKHHAYYSLLGISMSGHESKAFFGFYNNRDIIDSILAVTKYSKLAEGYQLKQIDGDVITSPYIKSLFLLYKKNPHRFEQYYLENFEKWSIKKTKNFECIHVLQDHCNNLIRIADLRGQKLVYEQITVFDTERKEKWTQVADKYGYSKDVIEKNFPSSKIEKQIENLEVASTIIVASNNTADSLSRYVPREKINVIPYGGDPTMMDSINPLAEFNQKETDTLNVLYIGSINLLKGVQYIIQAADELSSENIHFTFIGKLNYAEDKHWVAKIKSMLNCTYIESVPHIEISKYYLRNDIFIFQPLCEGFGMVTLEAMSCGLPCIVSKGGIGIIIDHIDGIVNEDENVDQIVSSIMHFYNNRSEIHRMGLNAYRNIQSNTWNSYAHGISKIYQKL